MNKKSKVINLRITEELYSELEELAVKMDRKPADAARSLIKEGILKYKNNIKIN